MLHSGMLFHLAQLQLACRRLQHQQRQGLVIHSDVQRCISVRGSCGYVSLQKKVCAIDASHVILQMPLRRHLEGSVGGGNLQNVLEHDPLRLHAVRCARCI